MAEAQREDETAGGRRSEPPFRADHVGSLLRRPGCCARVRSFIQVTTAGESQGD